MNEIRKTHCSIIAIIFCGRGDIVSWKQIDSYTTSILHQITFGNRNSMNGYGFSTLALVVEPDLAALKLLLAGFLLVM